MTLQDILYFIVILFLVYWFFNFVMRPDEQNTEEFSNFGAQWYWPSYWYNTYWPYYRRRYYDSYPYGYFPYQSYYQTYYF